MPFSRLSDRIKAVPKQAIFDGELKKVWTVAA
jgi:hypothetical protein